MPQYRISEAAQLLGVSDDTIRRWISAGMLSSAEGNSGRQEIDGIALAHRAVELAKAPPTDDGHTSARNRMSGLVTAVRRDGVMAQVDMQCGPFRVSSLMSAEAADELELTPGMRATAVVKATMVVIETPR